MCIIAAKPAGIAMPGMGVQKQMWENNPHGAGIMYAMNGTVHIEKGFMTWEHYEKFITDLGNRIDLDALSVVLHFRIKTHGEINTECCHPFPVTRSIDKMKKPRTTCTLGVAHNGIIDIVPRKGISDTMEYTATQLAPLYSAMPEFYKNTSAMELVENAIESKMALLNKKGEIYLIGKFVEKDGVKYSNDSYEPRVWSSFSHYNYGGGWEMNKQDAEYGFFRSSKKLMWCINLPVGSYIADFETGEKDDQLDDVAIDSEGNAYLYDYEFDGFEALNTKVYAPDGMTAKFVEKYADYECIIDW